MIIRNKKGNAWVGVLILMAFLAMLATSLVVESVNTIIQSKRSAQVLAAQALCDAGIDKTIWGLNNNSNYIGETGFSMPTGSLDISISGSGNERIATITSYVPEINPKVKRTVRARIEAEDRESGFSFRYGIQVGETGISMSNNSKVVGNVYSGGSISGGNGAYIMGDVYISGIGKSINNVRVGCPVSVGYNCPINGNAHVNTISNSYIYGNAYYNSISNTTVLGKSHPGSSPPNPIDLPLANTKIEQWKSWAEDGGTYTGDYLIDGLSDSRTLGPYKINGNLTVTNSSTLTLTGVLYVTGNITFSNLSKIKIDPSFGSKSGIIISDGKITTGNNVVISGSGHTNSYIMILSTSGVDPAINVSNNSASAVYYANRGYIDVANNARIKSLTGRGIRLKNGAVVEYDTGLANSNFSAGPGGSWSLKEWQVIH